MNRSQDAGDINNQRSGLVHFQERNQSFREQEWRHRVDGKGLDHLVGGDHRVASRFGGEPGVVDQTAEATISDLNNTKYVCSALKITVQTMYC